MKLSELCRRGNIAVEMGLYETRDEGLSMSDVDEGSV